MCWSARVLAAPFLRLRHYAQRTKLCQQTFKSTGVSPRPTSTARKDLMSGFICGTSRSLRHQPATLTPTARAVPSGPERRSWLIVVTGHSDASECAGWTSRAP